MGDWFEEYGSWIGFGWLGLSVEGACGMAIPMRSWRRWDYVGGIVDFEIEVAACFSWLEVFNWHGQCLHGRKRSVHCSSVLVKDYKGCVGKSSRTECRCQAQEEKNEEQVPAGT